MGGIALAVLLIAVMGGLFFYIRSLQDPGRAMIARPSDEAASAAELNKLAREGNLPKILFSSRIYSSGHVNDVDANLGPTDAQEVVRYFRFLHNTVSTQKALHNVQWNGGLQAKVKGVEVYLDADVSPALVDELAKVNDPAFSRLTLTEGATSATTRDCSSLVGDRMGYQGCVNRVQAGVESLLRRMPENSKQHSEVYLLMGESAGRFNQGVIQMRQRATDQLDTDKIASTAGALVRLYLETLALPEVKRVQIDPLQPLTRDPRVIVSFTDDSSDNIVCVMTPVLESQRAINESIESVNDELGLGLEFASDC